jgi:hypothetical protein
MISGLEKVENVDMKWRKGMERSKFKIVDIPKNNRNSGQERCKVQERH